MSFSLKEGVVGLLGRPNVGKSTLFNKLTRTRKAIVKNEPGVTRDVQIGRADWWGRQFRVADMGGLTSGDAGFSGLIRTQVLTFLKSVDLLIVVFDGKAGLMPEDKDILRVAIESGLPYICVVNKVDRHQDSDEKISDFYELGGDFLPAAFEKDYNIDEVVEWVLRHLPNEEVEHLEGLRLTIVGKPNAGKSSLANQLLGEERVLVSPIAGTTVDAIETPFQIGEEKFVLVDTAGLRKAGKQKDGVEVLSGIKSSQSIERTNLVLLVIDGVVGLSHQDATIVEFCLENHKPVILVVNKYDLAKDARESYREWFQENLAKKFHFFVDVPMVHVSAKTGYGLRTLTAKIIEIKSKLAIKIPTSKLNKFFTEVIKLAPAPVYGTVDVKFYYLTQTGQSPPSFIAFANHPDGVTPSYRRFLINKIQAQWGLEGIPIRIFVLPKGRGGGSRTRSPEAEAENIEAGDVDLGHMAIEPIDGDENEASL